MQSRVRRTQGSVPGRPKGRGAGSRPGSPRGEMHAGGGWRPLLANPLALSEGSLPTSCAPPEELRAENAFLRHQLTVFARGSKRPQFRARDHVLLLALSRLFSTALLLVKPDTLLRWHRDGFRLLWKWRSRKKPPPLPAFGPTSSPSSAAWPTRIACGAPSASAVSSSSSTFASPTEPSSGT